MDSQFPNFALMESFISLTPHKCHEKFEIRVSKPFSR